VNQDGLEGLYRVLLSDSAEWFVAALRHIKSKGLATLRMHMSCSNNSCWLC
jgi:hypothetical protein